MGEWVPNPPQDDVGSTAFIRLVQERFELTQGMAQEAYAQTKEYINDLQENLQALTPPSTEDIENVELPYVPEMNYTDRPSVGSLSLTYNWPTNKPVIGPMEVIPDIPEFELPIFSITTPQWQSPEKPSFSVLREPGDAPVVTMPDVPTAPSPQMPSMPALAEIVLPAPIDIGEIPTFDGQLPDDAINVPDGFSWDASPYNSPIWDTLLDKVMTGIRDGGTGLGADVESELIERARARQAAANTKAYRDIETLFISRGHRVPPGAMASQLQQVANASLFADAEVNGQIFIKQAELAQENTKFMIEQGEKMEGVLREFHNANENRALDAAKALANGSIEVYNAIVAKINIGLEAYKAKAVVYETTIRAIMARVEMFKAQVESAAVSATVQNNLVELYTKQLLAVETHINLYKAQMEGVKLRVEVQRQVLDVFKDQVGLYSAKVEARRALIDAYKSELDAEKSKAEVYSEQVRAYGITVEAKKTEASSRVEHIRSLIEANRATTDKYQAELSGYIAEIDGESKRISAEVEGFKGEVAAYSAETGAMEMMYGAKIKEIEARIQQGRFLIEKAVAEIQSATAGYVAIKELQSKGTEGIMNVGAQLTSAAWNAVNASASLGSSIGKNESHDYNHSESITETHSYQHE